MLTISPELQSLYLNGGTFLFSVKLQVLDKNYMVLEEFTDEIFDGQITCDKSRKSFRSFDMKLANVSGKLNWGEKNLIWLDKYFKPFIGVWVNGDWEWLPQGVYPCSQPISISQPDKNEVEFQGPDKMNYLGKCEDNITVSAGTDIAISIKSVLNGLETLFNLDDTSHMISLPYDMTWNAGTDYSKIITDLANIITWIIYYDANGYLRMHAPIDPTVTAPLLTLVSNGLGFNLWAGSERQLDDSNLANYIVVNGGSSQTALVNYVIQDDNPNSPTSIQNIGKRVYVHNNGNPDPVITTKQLAQYRATYELKNRIQVVEKLKFQMFICPFMEHDDVYEITDPTNGTKGKYQVMSYTLPLPAISQGSSFHTGYLWQVRNPLSYYQTILLDNPVGYWRLNELNGTAANDSSGNGINGTINSGVILGAEGLLSVSSDPAMQFDGKTGYISTPHSTLLDCTTSLSVEAWINPNSANSGDWVNKGDNTGYRMRTVANGSDVQFQFLTYSNSDLITTGSSYPINQIYHIVGVADSSGHKIYVNGQLVISDTTAYVENDITSGLTIGSDTGLNEYFSGIIDEVAIYNYALTPIQIAAHYSAGTQSR